MSASYQKGYDRGYKDAKAGRGMKIFPPRNTLTADIRFISTI